MKRAGIIVLLHLSEYSNFSKKESIVDPVQLSQSNLDKLIKEDSFSPPVEDIKRILLEQSFKATIILIDLTDSTALKSKKPFPEWYGLIDEFYTKSTKVFRDNKIEPIKFLGDAVLYFIPDIEDEKAQKYIRSQNETNRVFFPQEINHNTLLDICIDTQRNWWQSYKSYWEYPESRENFLSITTAIDYGLVIDFNLNREGGSPDPIGEAVDRCFRISSIAAPSNILFSNEFRDRLSPEHKDKSIKIAIGNKMLKGVKPQGYINYVLPEEDQIDWILRDDNRQLIEESAKPMSHKVKIKLLRRKIQNLEHIKGFSHERQ